MNVWYHRYELRARREAGLRSRVGALIRVGEGFADVHPWAELGDETLDAQLSSIANLNPKSLAARSLAHARVDAAARVDGRSWFADSAPPPSHWLGGTLDAVSFAELEAARAQGFLRAKVKAGTDLKRLARWPDGMALRLDCNARFANADEFLSAWKQVPSKVRDQTEFIEDPFPWDEQGWRRCAEAGAPLAFDRPGALARPPDGVPLAAVVLKPATQDALAPTPRPVVVTSYLDHPVGQCGAAREAAARSGPTLPCGLLSHFAYETSEFSERLATGPAWRSPGGTGAGFDDLLSRLPWKRLA